MIPTYLYKYRPINKNTLLNLVNHQIWFPKPCEIDDPYDCAIHIERKHITNDESEELFNLWKENKLFPGTNFSEVEGLYSTNGKPNERFKELFENAGKSMFTKERDNIINQWGVACFSEIYDDQNMWALYSDKHRGICLQFDCNYFFANSIQVNYKAEIPAMSIAEILKNQATGSLQLMTTTKAECWAYQKEVRIFMEQGNKNYNYDPKALTGLYFGVKTPDSDKELVFSILGRNFKDYYVMEKNEDIYKLERRLINFY